MEPFVHLPEYPFAICQKCKVGFITSEVANHLKRKHGNISQKERQRIKQAVATCEGVAKDQAELQGWILPPPTISPNPYIKPPQEDGLGCDDCPDDSSNDSSDDSSDDSSGDDVVSGVGRSNHGSTRGQRPSYRMTIRQEELWKAFDRGVTQVVNGTDRDGQYTADRLQRDCLDVVVQFLDHPFKNGNHYESIIIGALAIMGFDREGGGWVPAINYTPIYSAVIKVARYLVLYQSMLERDRQKAQLRQWMGERQAEEEAEGLFRIVRDKVQRFMTRIPEGAGVDPTPMNWIINTRTYGKQIRYTTPGTERIDWRGDQIIHGQVRITMGEISDMLHSLTIEARRTLVRLAIGKIEPKRTPVQSTVGDIEGGGDEEEDDIALPRIPWSKMEDRHGESALGHSFIKDEENQSWITAGEGWTRQQIISSSARYNVWISKPSPDEEAGEACPYKERAVRAYSQMVEQFRAQMFVLMHMLGGQPARSTEILGLRMWNTANGGIRNIFIHEGMVCFVTMYHKGFRQSDSIKVIHRYLPRENVQGRIKKKRRQSAFLWADEVVSEHGGKDGKGGFSKVRAAGISNNDDKAESQSQQEREEEAAFMDWFREKKWINDRARRALQRYSTQFSSQELNISGWRQMAIGISNRYFNKVFETDDDGDELDEDGNGSFIDSIYDLQAGHGSHIAGLIYARLFGQGELGTIRSREKFRKISSLASSPSASPPPTFPRLGSRPKSIAKQAHRITETFEPGSPGDSSVLDLQRSASKKRPAPSSLVLPRAKMARIRELSVGYIVDSNLPFTTFESTYLQELFRQLDSDLHIQVPWGRTTAKKDLEDILSLKKAAVKEELDEAVTQIHISFDLWTSPNRLAFISIFGHFIDRSNLYQSRLLAFRRQIGSHAGENIAYTVRNVVRDWGIDRKLGVSICDNAASNDVCLRSLYTTLDASVTRADTEARRMRCFGHILNLVAQAFLYGDDAASFELQSEAYGMLERVEEDLEHWRAKGPVGKLHNIVKFIRASPQRTEAFKAHAREQEEADIYKLAEESTAELEVIQNNATRWNSTYMMIERALLKQSELNSFIQELGLEADASRRVPTADILTSDDWKVLREVSHILEPIYNMTMRTQGWGTSGGHGRLWEVMTGMEFVLEHLEDWKVLYEDETANSALEERRMIQGEEPELAIGVKSTPARPSTVGQIRERPSRQSRLPSRLHGYEITPLHRRRETALPARPLTSLQFNEDALPVHSREDYLHDDARSMSNIASMEGQERASIRASINTAWIKLNEYYTLLGRSPLFAASVVLNPDLGLRWLETNWTSPEQLQWLRDAKDGIKAYFERWYSKNDDGASETILATSSSTPRPEQSRFEQWVKSRQPKLSATGSELERYYRLEPEQVNDPVRWWIDHSNAFPRLSRFALDVLAIPAMATDCERAFSLAKLTVSSQRHSLLGSSIESVQLLKNWIRGGARTGEVRFRNLEGHLKDRHPDLSHQVRSDLIRRHKGLLPTLLEEGPREDQLARHGSSNPAEPVEGLPIHRGFACTWPGCGYLTPSWKCLRMHFNDEHNAKAAKRKTQADLWAAVHLQTFFTGPKRAIRYFCVREVGRGEGEREEGGGSERRRRRGRGATTVTQPEDQMTIAHITKGWSLQQEEQEEMQKVMDEGILRHETTNWLKRTGWSAHFTGRNLMDIQACSKMPGRGNEGNDEVLRHMNEALDRLFFDRCIGGLKSMPLMTRLLLASPHPHDAHSRPFGPLQEKTSMDRYLGYIKRFLCYCLNVLSLEEEVLLADHGFRFTLEQRANLEKLWAHLQGEEDEEIEGDDDEAEEDEIEGGRPSSSRHNSPNSDEGLQERILQVLAGFWTQRLDGDPFASPLWHFVGVLGIDGETGQLRPAHLFTYVLAGLVFTGRALLGEWAIPTRERDGMEDLTQRFAQVRDAWLCKATYSPMGYILSLLLFGKKIARETGSRLMVSWSKQGEMMYFMGKPILMEDLRTMVAKMTADAEDLLWGQLMFKEGNDERFVIPLAGIEDDLTQTRRGQSFIHRNGLAGKEVEMLEDLTTSSRKTDLLDQTGEWKWAGIRKYLKLVKRFEEFLLLLAHITGGQPSRGEEITGLRLINGINRDRNIFIIDGEVVLVTQYHKSLAHFDSPKVIPRFLPGRIGQLFVMYMIYIRPLTDRWEADKWELYGEKMAPPSDFIWHNEAAGGVP
ncbi:hypothetical protein HZS61_011504 [Fusarium oxysporum f. sp. conglutinans]|uniref:C2H2-type domain-containing protein n=2 Tax=Fusarium oxysporum f. sp. conglutinans TaxID=100902 RepID=A0A8H6LML7_FUSOX|nr:hypothetical protein HZS61_011504 [Fusarium oxysporum f. sp. conglutinans]